MMKKSIVALCVLGLIGSLLVAPASAGKKKAKPVATTMYFHGVQPAGEIDGAQWLADTLQGSATKPPQTLDGVEPTGGQPKSQGLRNPALNDQCSGLPPGFPTFQGDFAGTIIGDATITAYFASPPGTVTARLWTDTPVFSCNDGYVAPASEVVVDVPAGQSEVQITFEHLNLKGSSWILIELLGDGGATQGRLLYDSTSAMTRIEFNCIPASGKSCLPQ
jgi:hypothetical protein